MRTIAKACIAAAIAVSAASTFGARGDEPKLVWKEAPLVVGAAYSAQGPGPLRYGQAEGMTDNPVVGAVESLAAHPTDSNILWAGAVNGGIWKTSNATSGAPSWTNQTPSMGSLSIAALEIDPTDATASTLYAGFAGRSSWSSLGGALNGLLKTTDGGATWTAAGATLAGRSIGGIAPRGSIVVAAVFSPTACTDGGIWRSTDGGGTFTHVSNTAALPCGRTFDLAGDPLNPSHLFTVVTSATTAANNGVYRSTDTGLTWTKLTTPFDATFSAGTAISRAEIAVGRRGTAGNGGAAGANVFFASCTGGRLAGLYASTNAGSNWSTLDRPFTPDPASNPEGLHPGGQCGTHLSIVADPFVHTAVYVGGDRQPYATEGINGTTTYFPNSLGANNYSGRIFRSNSASAVGSQTYPMTHCSAVNPGCGGAVRTAGNSAPHADSREMVFLPNGDLVESDDGGVYLLHLPNTVSANWSSLMGSGAGSIRVQEQHNTRYDQVSKVVFSGNQDTGSGMQSATGSTTWNTLNQGDGGAVAVGRNDPVAGQSTRYHSSQNLGGFTRRVYNSSNGQLSWTNPALTLLGGAPTIGTQFATPVVVNSVAPARLLVGATNGVYESADRGGSVSRVTTSSVNAPSSGGGPTMVYGVTGNADAVYVASGTNVLVRTAAPPAAFTTTSPAGGTVRALAVKPGDLNRAVAVTSTGVFTTANAGGVWTNVTANLAAFNPGTYRSAAYVEGSSDDTVVVGADRGVYRARVSALGAGNSWDVLGTGLPNAPVFELSYDVNDDVLAAGTMGRGAFTLTGLQAISSCAAPTALVTGSASLCAGAATTISASLTGTGPWTITWSDAVVQTGVAVSPATRSVSPSSTTTYAITAMTDLNCTAQPAGLTGSAVVTVAPDTAPPVVTAPGPITANQARCCGVFGGASGRETLAIATFLAAGSASDDCDLSPSRLAPQVSGADASNDTCFESGETTVTFRYRDSSGKTGSARSSVTIRMFGDLNLDTVIDGSDMVVLRAFLNGVAAPGTPPFIAPLELADTSHDGLEDGGDMVVLRAFLNGAILCMAP